MLHLNIDVHETGGITVLKVSGLLNSDAYYETRDRIRSLVDSGKKKIVIDMSGVERVGGTGWNAIEETIDEKTRKDSEIKICCMIEPVYRVFEKIGLKGLVKTFPTLKDALENFKP